MGNGIIIFGANGSGKTTIGRLLAQSLNYRHIDAEDFYFEKSNIPYSNSRTKDLVIKLMLEEISKYGSFVLSSVMGDYGDEIEGMYQLAIYVTAPLNIRIERVRQRTADTYGRRVLLGGDMYAQEQQFIDFIKNRDVSQIDAWAKTLQCPVINVDSTKNINDNIQLVVKQYMSIFKSKE